MTDLTPKGGFDCLHPLCPSCWHRKASAILACAGEAPGVMWAIRQTPPFEWLTADYYINMRKFTFRNTRGVNLLGYTVNTVDAPYMRFELVGAYSLSRPIIFRTNVPDMVFTNRDEFVEALVELLIPPWDWVTPEFYHDDLKKVTFRYSFVKKGLTHRINV